MAAFILFALALFSAFRESIILSNMEGSLSCKDCMLPSFNTRMVVALRNYQVTYSKPPQKGFGTVTVGGVELIGEWKGKKLNGLGMTISHDGLIYEGQWKVWFYNIFFFLSHE